MPLSILSILAPTPHGPVRTEAVPLAHVAIAEGPEADVDAAGTDRISEGDHHVSCHIYRTVAIPSIAGGLERSRCYSSVATLQHRL